MIQIHRQEMPRVLRRGTVGGVDVFERSSTRFAQRLHARRRGKVVADVRARCRAREVRPSCSRHRFRPTRTTRLGRAIHRECVVAVETEAAIFDDGFRRAVGSAAHAVAEADDFVVEHKPRFARAQSAAVRVQVHGRHAVESLQRRAADLVVRGAAIGIAGTVRAGIRLDGGARHPVRVHRGPEIIRVVGEVRVVQVGHAVGREPAVQIFAARRFIIGDAIGRHGQTKSPTRLPVNHAIHAGELLVPRRVHERHDVGVIHHRVSPHVERWNFLADKIAAGVRLNSRLHERFVSGGISGWGELGDAQNGAKQIMSRRVVVARARVIAPTHHRHQTAPEKKRLEGLINPAEEIRLCRVRHLPCGSLQQLKHRTHRVQHLHAVAARVGKLVVKNERAVRVESVAGGDVWKHITQRRAAQVRLDRIFHDDAPEQDREGLPHLVRRRHVG